MITIHPQKRNDKIYEIISINEDKITIKNDFDDVKVLNLYEFDIQNINPEINKTIVLVRFEPNGCSIIEENFE
ncbi:MULTISPECIES: hypothetical protein [Ureaplasma]|uniref:Uncharacterized protein n=2 Tax=Ureaplasma TaxID=2129 RepID=A0ABT3BNI6_9BACT|nr:MULTISPECIES: hypothetical protein [Ureaplasma]MCV3728480.1 hypothetical protein [Ureaplasma miroungigenitalium]MCV3734267.1 hypothetical protein [Ureaplasma miroungigenitalium]MCV3753809.1 hypothetical protein [Ureaplasma zalophigenitalium]